MSKILVNDIIFKENSFLLVTTHKHIIIILIHDIAIAHTI